MHCFRVELYKVLGGQGSQPKVCELYTGLSGGQRDEDTLNKHFSILESQWVLTGHEIQVLFLEI